MPSAHYKIFDPGIEPTSINYHGDEDLHLDLHHWAMSMLNTMNKPQSIVSGCFKTGDVEVCLNSILFDTGALHRSYINQSLVNENRDQWACNIRPYNSQIRLGDQKTIINSSEEIQGTLSFHHHNVTANISCIVHDMPGMDMIIGLPDIQQHFLAMLFDILSKDPTDNSSLHTSQVFSAEPTPPDCYVWSCHQCPEQNDTIGTL